MYNLFSLALLLGLAVGCDNASDKSDGSDTEHTDDTDIEDTEDTEDTEDDIAPEQGTYQVVSVSMGGESCDLDELADPEVWPYLALDLTMSGGGSLELDFSSGTGWECTIDGSSFACDAQESSSMGFTTMQDFSGEFSSTTAFDASWNISMSCTDGSSDCDTGMELPCEAEVAISYEMET